MDQCITKKVLEVYTMDTRYIYSAVITQPGNPTISKLSRPCYEYTSVWSMSHAITADVQ